MRKNHEPLGIAVGACVAALAVVSVTTGAYRSINPLTIATGTETPTATAYSSAVADVPTAIASAQAQLSRTDTTLVPTLLPELVAPTAGHPPAQDFAQRVLAEVNRVRAEGRICGKTRFGPAAPLSLHDRLMEAAQQHALDQAKHRFMSHSGSNGSSPAERVTAAGYAWYGTAENVAKGQTTADKVVDSWAKSEGHCRNIMDPTYMHMGIGRAEDDLGIPYWAQSFGAPR